MTLTDLKHTLFKHGINRFFVEERSIPFTVTIRIPWYRFLFKPRKVLRELQYTAPLGTRFRFCRCWKVDLGKPTNV